MTHVQPLPPTMSAFYATESYFQWARQNPCLFETELGHGGFQQLSEEEQRRLFFDERQQGEAE